MPTKKIQTTLFVFCHQDDEFGIFHEIETTLSSGNRAVAVYLTDGGVRPHLIDKRNAESTAVLSSLGMGTEEIIFLGQKHDIPDGKLFEHVEKAYTALEALCRDNNVSTLFCPAWEGGHQDHDIAYALCSRLIRLNTVANGRQFPLYNGYNTPGPLFRVFSPLPINGEISSEPISLVKRLKYIALCLNYRSQLTTWAALFPFVSSHLLFIGIQVTQPVRQMSVPERPHEGKLYYERRFSVSWKTVCRAASSLLATP
jgi:LmbE family N-acetylglucosaminyl deacetylase